MRLLFWNLRTETQKYMLLNGVVSVIVGYPQSSIHELRRAFAIPESYADERVLEVLIRMSINNYMDVEHINPEELQDAITEGVIAKRWMQSYQ